MDTHYIIIQQILLFSCFRLGSRIEDCNSWRADLQTELDNNIRQISIFLSSFMSYYISIYLSIYLYFLLYIYLSFYLPICFTVFFICRNFNLPTYLITHLSPYQSEHLYSLYPYQSNNPSIFLTIYPIIYPIIYPFIQFDYNLVYIMTMEYPVTSITL